MGTVRRGVLGTGHYVARFPVDRFAMRRLVAASLLVWATFSASALDLRQGLTTVASGAGSQSVVPAAGSVAKGQVFTTGLGGEARVAQLFDAMNPSGKPWSGTARRAFPWVAVGKVAANAAKLLGGVAAGVALADALNDVRCHYSGGGFLCSEIRPPDPGVGLEYQAGFIDTGAPPGPWRTTEAAACTSASAGPNRAPPIYSVGSGCRSYSTIPGLESTYVNGGIGTRPAQTTCAAGFEKILETCWAEVQEQPQTQPQVETRFDQYADKTKAGDILKDAVSTGADVGTAPLTIEGPSSTAGSTKGTTGPSGTKTETTTHNHTYAGNTVTYNNSTTITTVNNAGDVTTETTESEPEQKDPCELNPESVMCAKLDTPEAPEWADTEIPVTFTPDTGFGPDTGSCPADVALPVRGTSLTWSYRPMCGFFEGIRPAVLALAWVAAAFIVLGMRKAEEA